MPSAPNCSASNATLIRSGLLPPLLFLMVAILLILTERRVMRVEGVEEVEEVEGVEAVEEVEVGTKIKGVEIS